MLRDPYGDRFDMDDDPFAEPMEPETCSGCTWFLRCDIEGHREVGWCEKCCDFMTAGQEICDWVTEGRTWQ